MSRRQLPWKRMTSNTVESNNGMLHTLMEWSSCSSWLALASQSNTGEGSVDFIINAESKLSPVALRRNCLVTSLRWHPAESWLAVGWQDGTAIIAATNNESVVTVNDCPSAIAYIDWSHDGKVLCCVSQEGNILLYSLSWKKSIKATKIAEYTMNEAPNAFCKMLLYGRPPTQSFGDDDGDGMQEVEQPLPPSTRKMGVRVQPELARAAIGTGFLVSGELENLHYIDDTGTGLVVYRQFDSTVGFLGFYEEKSLLVAMTSSMMMHHLTVDAEGKWTEKLKAKMNGKFEAYRIVLAENLLLMAYREKEVRVWDLESEDNGTIQLQASKGFEADEVCVCVTYSKRKGTISAGTSDGKVANWKRRPGEGSTDTMWRLQTAHQVGSEIHALSWSSVHSTLAVNSGTDITMLQDDHNLVSMRAKIAAIQTSATSFTLLNVISTVSQELKLTMAVTGIHVGEKQLVVWNKDTVITYDVQTSLATIASQSFNCVASDVIIFHQTLYCIEKDKIIVRTLSGTVRQIISLPEMEGDPVFMSNNRSWLAVATSNGFLRIYDLSKKEVRQEYHSKYVIEVAENFSKWARICLNSQGNRIACTFYEDSSALSDRLLVWDAESDTVHYFSFDRGMTDQQEYEAEAELANTTTSRPVTAAARKMEREQSRFRMMLHRPGAICWDETDPRYLVCEAVHNTPEAADNLLLSMFATSDHGLQLQDLQRKTAHCDALVGVSVPHMYFLKKSEYDEEEVRGEKTVGRLLISRTLREFAGLEQCDEATRKAMMDFSLHLTIGQMDDAFKAIQGIQSNSVWEQMASMSVKTRRLDVAAVCLGRMKNVRAARALRRAQQNGESPAMQCAAIALQLGMLEEAEALYASNDRYDMVNKIEQAQNQWTQAFDIAARKDRIHLRNTHYNYARFLEESNKTEMAIENFELSDTHQFEVPRLFKDNHKQLEAYIRKKREPELHRWWALFLESIGELEGAVNFYTVAKDNLAVVKINCMMGKTEEAAELAQKTGDKAACYHMARVFEGLEDYPRAVALYTKARAFSSAIRLAKEHDMRDRLANLCLMAGGSEMVEAARYYEDIPGYAHKAVMLYHKAGMIGRALDLAFRTEQFSALDLVAKDLDNTCEPTTLKRAAEFFENNQNYEKAVELLCMAREFGDALSLCKKKNVTLTERVAELITPTKDTTPSANERKELLFAVAELCVQQGAYIIAAKKYTQAGDKIKAMKALLRSGDAQKIRFFANTARSKEIYILAANFLQTTHWQGNAEIIKDIETFYAKSQSIEHLANFYVACAFMEIENWSDFEKAGEALEQAVRCLETGLSKNPESKGMLSAQERVNHHLGQLKKFNKIKSIYATDPTDAVRQLQVLAEAASEDDIIRPGHIFSLLISHHAGKESWNAAYRCITQLKKQQPKLDLTTIVAAEILDKICDEMRVERVTSSEQKKGAESDDDGEQIDFSHAMKRRQQNPLF